MNQQEKRSQQAVYRPIFVTIEGLDDDVRIPAYSTGLRWNGWQQPVFPKASAMLVAKLMPKQVAFDEERKLVRVTDEEGGTTEEFEMRYIEVDGESVAVYDIGSGWCWEKMSQRLFEGNWVHIFGPGRTETTCRIVVDAGNDVLVAVQAFDGLKWVDLSSAEVKDLADSLFVTNAVSADPKEFNLSEIQALPEWAVATQANKAHLSEETLNQIAIGVKVRFADGSIQDGFIVWEGGNDVACCKDLERAKRVAKGLRGGGSVERIWVTQGPEFDSVYELAPEGDQPSQSK